MPRPSACAAAYLSLISARLSLKITLCLSKLNCSASILMSLFFDPPFKPISVMMPSTNSLLGRLPSLLPLLGLLFLLQRQVLPLQLLLLRSLVFLSRSVLLDSAFTTSASGVAGLASGTVVFTGSACAVRFWSCFDSLFLRFLHGLDC